VSTAPEDFPSARDLALHFGAVRRKARTLLARVRHMPLRLRPFARRLLQEVYDIEVRIDAGLPELEDRLLLARDLLRLENAAALALGEARPIDLLEPERMLRARPPVCLQVERPLSPPVLRIRWPLQHDSYKFEVLGRLLFAFVETAERQERRTQACLETLPSLRFAPSHERVEKPVEKHDGEYAMPPASRAQPLPKELIDKLKAKK
jgi:hypothetical protein